MQHTALAKLANIAWQTALLLSESLAMNKKVTLDLTLSSAVSQFWSQKQKIIKNRSNVFSTGNDIYEVKLAA